MASGLNDLLDSIIKLEEKIKEKYPKAQARVKIANAKQNTDYSFKDIDNTHQMEWCNVYHDELHKWI